VGPRGEFHGAGLLLRRVVSVVEDDGGAVDAELRAVVRGELERVLTDHGGHDRPLVADAEILVSALIEAGETLGVARRPRVEALGEEHAGRREGVVIRHLRRPVGEEIDEPAEGSRIVVSGAEDDGRAERRVVTPVHVHGRTGRPRGTSAWLRRGRRRRGRRRGRRRRRSGLRRGRWRWWRWRRGSSPRRLRHDEAGPHGRGKQGSEPEGRDRRERATHKGPPSSNRPRWTFPRRGRCNVPRTRPPNTSKGCDSPSRPGESRSS
jgi:hypothetical protein